MADECKYKFFHYRCGKSAATKGCRRDPKVISLRFLLSIRQYPIVNTAPSQINTKETFLPAYKEKGKRKRKETVDYLDQGAGIKKPIATALPSLPLFEMTLDISWRWGRFVDKDVYGGSRLKWRNTIIEMKKWRKEKRSLEMKRNTRIRRSPGYH